MYDVTALVLICVILRSTTVTIVGTVIAGELLFMLISFIEPTELR